MDLISPGYIHEKPPIITQKSCGRKMALMVTQRIAARPSGKQLARFKKEERATLRPSPYFMSSARPGCHIYPLLQPPTLRREAGMRYVNFTCRADWRLQRCIRRQTQRFCLYLRAHCHFFSCDTL